MQGGQKKPVRDNRASKRMALARKACSIALSVLLALWLIPTVAFAQPLDGASQEALESRGLADGGMSARAFAGFSDVVGDEWFVTDGWLSYVVDHGLMEGDDAGRFAPQGHITRAQVVTVLWRMEGEPLVSASEFSDVDYGEYYGNAVAWARSAGVVQGSGSNEFRPDDPITREELAVMLARYAGAKGVDTATDQAAMDAIEGAVDVSTWARDGFGWAVDAGLVAGSLIDGVSYLLPQNQTTRAEFAKMASVLHRDVLGLDVLVDYADGVTIVAPSAYQQSGEHAAVVEVGADSVKQGDVVVLEPSEENPAGGVMKVESVTELPGGFASIEGSEPEFSEVVDELSITGTTAELVSFEPAPGVEVLSEPEARAVFGDEAELFSQTFSIGSFGTVGLDLAAEYTIGYRDGGFSEIDLAFEAEADFVWECSGTISDAIKCGSATFVTNVPGLMIGADVYVTYTVEGGMRLEAVATSTAGVAYADDDPSDGVDGAWNTYCDSDFSCEAQLSARARGGIEPALVLEYLTIELVDASLGMGQEANAEVNVRASGMVCTDMALWVYVDLSIGRFDSVASKLGLQHTWELMGRENNPTLIERHTEDGVTVEACTWEEEPDEPAPDPDPDPEDPVGPVEPSAFFSMLPDEFSHVGNRPPEHVVTLSMGADGSFFGRYDEVYSHSPYEYQDTGQYYTNTHVFSEMRGSCASPTQVSEHVFELTVASLDADTVIQEGRLEGDTLVYRGVHAGFVGCDEGVWRVFAPGTTAEELYEFGELSNSYLDPETGTTSTWLLHFTAQSMMFEAPAE